MLLQAVIASSMMPGFGGINGLPLIRGKVSDGQHIHDCSRISSIEVTIIMLQVVCSDTFDVVDLLATNILFPARVVLSCPNGVTASSLNSFPTNQSMPRSDW